MWLLRLNTESNIIPKFLTWFLGFQREGFQKTLWFWWPKTMISLLSEFKWRNSHAESYYILCPNCYIFNIQYLFIYTQKNSRKTIKAPKKSHDHPYIVSLGFWFSNFYVPKFSVNIFWNCVKCFLFLILFSILFHYLTPQTEMHSPLLSLKFVFLCIHSPFFCLQFVCIVEVAF